MYSIAWATEAKSQISQAESWRGPLIDGQLAITGHFMI